MKKILLTFFLTFFLSAFFVVPSGSIVSAQGILPSTVFSHDECEDFLSYYATREGRDEVKSEIQKGTESSDTSWMTNLLACAVKTGRFHLWMLPFLALYLIEFLSGLAGLISVAFIVLGGYHFIIGSLSEEKEKGKKTVTYALIGFVLSMLAYTIVNIVQVAVTS